MNITKELNAWIRSRTRTHETKILTPDEMDALRAAFVEGRATNYEFVFERTMGHVTNAGAEHYDSSGMSLFDIPLDSSNLRKHVSIDAAIGQGKHIVPADDDSQVRGEIIAETSQHNEQDIVTTQIEFNAYQLSSKFIPVNESLMFTHPTYASYILSRLARRLVKGEEFYCLQGSGTNEPAGLNGVAPDSGVAISTAGVTYEQMVSIEHSVNQDYRRRSIWIVSPATAEGIKNITDAAGRPCYIPQTPLGEWPPTFLGHPIVETPRCPDTHLFFGDPSYIHYRESVTARLIQSSEARAEYNQTLFGAVMTFDSGLSNVDSNDPPLTRSAVS